MKEEELCKKRLHDLSMQSYHKEIVLFSDFLNLNERNIYESNKHTFSTKSESFGGYELAERQMVAFIPDALCYEWTYPIVCLKISPKYPKFAEKLQHRDVLGALMHLGIERCTMGDLFQQDNAFYLFVQDHLCSFIQENLLKVRNTCVTVEEVEDTSELSSHITYETVHDVIASNRLDCIIAKAYHFSRSQASEQFLQEKVFVNGKSVTDCNYHCKDGDLISVRQKGRFRLRSDFSEYKKGKLRVSFDFFA